MLVVDRLAGILLQMQPLDADGFRSAVHVDLDLAFADDRILELADLIALRQIRIEVVLAVEDAAIVDLRLEAQPGAYRLRNALLVDDRQHARHGRIDETDVAVRFRAEGGRRSRKQLGLRRHLRMHFQPDHDFPIAGGALE